MDDGSVPMEAAVTVERRKPGRRKAGSIDEEIAAQEARLRALREKKKRDEAARFDRNRRTIYELLRAERLDAVDAAKWKAALPEIRRALLGESASAPPI